MDDRSVKRLPWDLDWNLLRTFMVIVEQGGITLAADHLGLKQPTVSNALKRLEDRIEKNLIKRKPNYFRVTAAGNLLYQECVEVFGTVSRLPGLISDADDEIAGHISIALASHVISPLLDNVLSRFNQQNPKVTFSISVSESQEVIKSLIQKRASLGVCLVNKQDARLEHQVIYRQYFGFFCGPKHRLFGQSGLKLKDLEGEPSVSFQTDHESGALHDVTLLRSQARLASNLTGVSSSLQEVRRMIIAGMGIGPLPLHVAQRDVDDGILWQLPPYESLPPIDINLVTNPRSNKNRAEEGLIALLQEEIRKTPLSGRTYTKANLPVR